MSVEPFAENETSQVEPIDGSSPPPADEADRPDSPAGEPDGLGSEREAAPFTSETQRPVQGVAEALGNTGFDESEKADPALPTSN